MSESNAKYDEGTDSRFTGVLEDDQSPAQVITLASLTSITLTLTDSRTGTVINGRSNQNVKNQNDVAIGTSNGALTWNIQPADTTPLDLEAAWAEHKALFKFTYDLAGEPKVGEHLHRLRIRNFTQLCTVADVKEFLPALAKKDEYYADLLLDVVAMLWEQRTDRRIRAVVDPSPATEIFSIRDHQQSVQIQRYPVTSVVDVVEEPYGLWSSGTVIDPETYTIVQDVNFCRLVRRDIYFTPGTNCLRVRFYGGLARDVGEIDADLRWAAARQAAFWLQRRDQIGVTSISASPGGVSTMIQRFEKNLLPEVVDIFDGYKTVWL